MTRKRMAKLAAIALPVLFLLAVTPAFFPGGRSPQPEAGLQLGTQVALRFTNDVGVEVCGLQVEFNLPPAQVLEQIGGISPFKTAIPIIGDSNVIYFTDGCIAPSEQVELQLASSATATAGLAVVDYYWVMKDKSKTLIPGNSPIERIVKTVTLDKLALMKDQPQPPLVTVQFEIHSPPYGKLLIAQGDMVYENGLIAIKDQPRRDELLAELASVKREKLRQELEAELAALEVRAPVSGLVKELRVEMGETETTVTLKVLQGATQ